MIQPTWDLITGAFVVGVAVPAFLWLGWKILELEVEKIANEKADEKIDRHEKIKH